MTTTVTLTSQSGRKYAFSVATVNDLTSPVPGLYAFVDKLGWPKYIGETKDYRTRPIGVDHEKWSLAASYGATHVLVLPH